MSEKTAGNYVDDAPSQHLYYLVHPIDHPRHEVTLDVEKCEEVCHDY